jgi:hypothetical protein
VELTAAHPPIGLSEHLSLILAGLRQVVAARGGRGGLAGPLIALLCGRLIRLERRFATLLAAFRAGRLRAPRPRAAASARVSRPVPSLPGGSGWLIRRCGWQAAGCGSQLRQLLAEPEMAALLLAAPQAGRLFRPLCRMLAVELPPELARERRRGKRAASPDAAQARAGASCYRWRTLTVADEAEAASLEAPAPLVVSRLRSGAADCDGGVSPPHLDALRLRESCPNPCLSREAVGRGVGPPDADSGFA